MRSHPPTRGARVRRLAIDVLLAAAIAPVLVFAALRELYTTEGFVEVADDQVAVLVDALARERRVRTVPGYQFFVPWKEEVHVLDKSPDELVFEGTQWVLPNQAPWIEARGKDGSRFSFERFALSYALVAERADLVLEDAGPGDGFKRDLVRAYARAYVRDEIGRLTPEEVLRPDLARAATTRAMERMNAALLPHGIEVLEVATPKPTFDKAFEDLLNRRKQGDLEIERKGAYIAQLPEERADRLQAIRDDKERELDLLRRNLAVNEAAAEREAQKLRLDADIVFSNRSKAGEAAKVELATRAEGLRRRNTAALEDARRETENLESYGEFAVRAALVQRLSEVHFRLLPYSRDAAPKRVEHEDVPASAVRPSAWNHGGAN